MLWVIAEFYITVMNGLVVFDVVFVGEVSDWTRYRARTIWKKTGSGTNLIGHFFFKFRAHWTVLVRRESNGRRVFCEEHFGLFRIQFLWIRRGTFVAVSRIYVPDTSVMFCTTIIERMFFELGSPSYPILRTFFTPGKNLKGIFQLGPINFGQGTDRAGHKLIGHIFWPVSLFWISYWELKWNVSTSM